MLVFSLGSMESLSAKNGLMNIVYDSGTFIRNQNIKGCDYD